MKCYRVCFTDGSAVLVNANDEDAAHSKGDEHLVKTNPLENLAPSFPVESIIVVDRIECLS